MNEPILYLRIEGSVNGERESIQTFINVNKIDGWISRNPPPKDFLVERIKLFLRNRVIDEKTGNWFFDPPLGGRWGDKG